MANRSGFEEITVMARRSLPSTVSSSDLPLRLTDVDIVADEDEQAPATIEGAAGFPTRRRASA